MIRYVVTALLFAMVAVNDRAYAQEKGQVGVTMGYPAAIGVVWHISDRLAIRPEVSFSHSWSETTSPAFKTFTIRLMPGLSIPSQFQETITDSSWSVNTGVSGLIYLTKHEGLRTFLTPGFFYSRGSHKSETKGGVSSIPIEPLIVRRIPIPSSFESTVSSYHIRGAFGAQYAVHRRFSVVGDVGLQYNGFLDSNSSFGSSVISLLGSPGEQVGHFGSFGTVAAVGVVLYFK